MNNYELPVDYELADLPEPEPSNKPGHLASAWFVHLVTASGAVWGFLAVLASVRHEWQAAVFWMALTVIVDGLDGTLARKARVKQVLPDFDGALLDNMVDYLTYVIVPAVFLYEADMLPASLAVFGAAMILLSSAYQFCQGDAKTDDHYFKGFPSYWNVAVFYMFILGMSQWVNLIVVAVLSILVFVPIKYVYPSRTVPFQRVTLVVTALWGIVGLVLLALFPTPPVWLTAASLLYVVYYLGVSLYLTFRSGRGRG
jgi:phosphatidylcholine synthase